MWECECIFEGEELAKRKALRNVLPKSLQHGIPSMLVTALDTTFWGTDRDQCTELEDKVQNAIGIRTNKHAKWHQENAEENAKCLYKERGVVTNGRNARQVFQQIKGKNQKDQFARTHYCNDAAPDDINVYTDGSLKNNRRSYFSLAGVGVWWPNRDTSILPLSEAEEEMGIAWQTPGGLALKTSLAGHGGSSTRAEIAGGILACQANQPVHIGTDSQAFMDKAKYVISLVRTGRMPKRPWSTHKDGDLWEMLHKSIIDKGHHAIRLTKV